MDDNDRIFREFWESYQWSDPPKIFWRLYHDDQGRPLSYSMEDLPGNYIDITPEQYQASDFRVVVRDGKIHHLSRMSFPCLVPSDSGTRCHPLDVTIVVGSDKPGQHWTLK